MLLVDLIQISITVLILVLCIVLFYFNYGKIMSFFFPNRWNFITMLEADNNVSSWFQKKNADLKCEFNGGFYNMYDKVLEDKYIPSPDGSKIRETILSKQQTSIYKNGRLAQFFFIEGIEDPLDFRANKITSNPQMRKQILSVDLTKLWTMGNSFSKWILYALVGLFLGFIIGNFIGGYGKMPIPKPVTQSLMLLWMVKNARKP